jgi:predicted RNase H-like HicB family nuclease
MTAKRTFWVLYSRDDNDMWLAEVYRNPDLGERLGVATHGRTLKSAEANVREALALWFDVDDEQSFTLLRGLSP